MKNPLLIFLIIVSLLSAFIIALIKIIGPVGNYIAQFYMLTPAIAAIITRLFFYEKKFSDANIRFGKISHYVKFWLFSLGITVVSYIIFTIFGSVEWDFSGQIFLERLAKQFEMAGQNIQDTLPEGFTPELMLWLYFAGGLTVLNILPGLITGLGEELGWRGFMFPLLYKIKPIYAFGGGGVIWVAWHLPLALIIPQEQSFTIIEQGLNISLLIIGGICSFTYLSYVYVKTENIFVTAIAHIVMNNSAASFSYFIVMKNQLLANAGLCLTMIIVVIILYYTNELKIFREKILVR